MVKKSDDISYIFLHPSSQSLRKLSHFNSSFVIQDSAPIYKKELCSLQYGTMPQISRKSIVPQTLQHKSIFYVIYVSVKSCIFIGTW